MLWRHRPCPQEDRRCVALTNNASSRNAAYSPSCVATGVSSYDISLEKQEVIVKTAIPYDDIHAKIAKTGKKIVSGETVTA